MDDEHIISLENIYKYFGNIAVLKDVSFHLKKGFVQALVGGNGAGKSTLMKILTGVYSCDQGVIKIDGQEVKINKISDAQKLGIRMIFQELSLSPTMTVMENIFLSNEIKSGIMLNKKEMYARTQQLLDELQIDAQPSDKIQDLDVGVCQLIEIAKALSVDAKVLIMDEPTASLTDRETKILFDIIENLKKKGVSIVYISHRMKEVFQIADSITILRDGEIVAEKPKEEFTLDSVIELMIGRNVEKKMEFVKREASVGDEVFMSIEDLTVGNRVHGVSFDVRKGEVLGLAGLMGSGRTETLEAIFGIRKDAVKKITIENKEVSIKNVDVAIQNGIALIPEDRRRQGLVLDHTVKDNLCLPNLKKLSNWLKIKRSKVIDMIVKCIESLAIKTDSAEVEMLNLSGGNQQKVVIAKWLETNPKLLLMDEPTAGIDVVAKGEIIDIVRKFAAQNNSVIFVSSEATEMLAICDRILVYSSGKIVQEIDRESILSEEMLEYAIQQ